MTDDTRTECDELRPRGEDGGGAGEGGRGFDVAYTQTGPLDAEAILQEDEEGVEAWRPEDLGSFELEKAEGQDDIDAKAVEAPRSNGQEATPQEAGERHRADELGDERPHPHQPAGQARSKGRRSRQGGEAQQQEPVRDPGDQLEALIRALSDIRAVLGGERRWCVVNADCIEFLRCLPGGSFDHVITDPPYEAEAHNLQRRKKGTRVDGTGSWQRRGGQTVQAPVNFDPITEETRNDSASQIARLAKRWAIVFCQSEAAMLWRAALEPLVYKRTCVWVKPDGMPQLTGDRPGMGYESMVCCHTQGRSAWNGGGRTGVFTHNKTHGAGAGIRNDHPTTKPDALMCELVNLFTDPNDVILDPFAGSGTTLVAALRMGRRAVGIELDPKYAALCVERCQSEDAGSTVHAARAGQEALFPR